MPNVTATLSSDSAMVTQILSAALQNSAAHRAATLKMIPEFFEHVWTECVVDLRVTCLADAQRILAALPESETEEDADLAAAALDERGEDFATAVRAANAYRAALWAAVSPSVYAEALVLGLEDPRRQ